MIERIAVLQGSAGQPAWLTQIGRMLDSSDQGRIVCLWERSDQQTLLHRSATHALTWPVTLLEGRAYVPDTIKARDTMVPHSSVDQRVISSSADLVTALVATRPDILLCEGDMDAQVLRDAAAAANCRIWILNECWSEKLPPSYVRSYQAAAGFVDVNLSEICPDGRCKLLESTRSRVSTTTLLDETIHLHFWKISELILRGIRHRPATEEIEAPPAVSRLSVSEIGWLALASAAKRFGRMPQTRLPPVWALAIGKPILSGQHKLSDFQVIEPPSGRYCADPFIVEEGGKHYVFFEEVVIGENKGRIAVAEIGDDGLLGPAQTVLSEPWHLSYPNVFKIDGQWYMIPESGAVEVVNLYAATSFPNSWTRVRSILSGVHAYDVTHLHHDGRWWFFATVSTVVSGSSCDDLFIYYTDDPVHGELQPHAANPVVSDITSARPAGAFIKKGQRLLRPSQDSRAYYGYGLLFNEVVKLSTTEYEERPLRRIHPGGADGHSWKGVHTYNECGDFAIIDVLR